MRPLCGLSEACSLLSSYGLPKATLGILDRPQTPLGSWQACLFSWPVPSLPLLSYSRPALGLLGRPQTPLGSWQACLFSWPVPGLPLLFLRNVRHCGPPPNPSRQLAGLPLSSYGFRKQRYALWTAPKPFSAAGRPASNVRHFGPPPNPSRQLAGLPLLFLWASESNVTHFGRPSNPSRQLAGLPLLFLWVSESNIIAILDRPQTLLRSWQRRCPGSKPLPGTLGCTFLHRSLACESRCYSWSLSISSCRACSPELASSLSGIVFLKVCCVWPECAQRAVLTRPHCGMRGTFADAGVSAR